MTKVFLELDHKNDNRIEVVFDYDPQLVVLVREVEGRRFKKETKTWTVPRDLETCRYMRQLFGSKLIIGKSLKSWAKVAATNEFKALELASARNAPLPLLEKLLPDLAMALRPYQRAGAAFISRAAGALVADEPRLGKTLETIAGIAESNLLNGKHLVIAPKSSLEDVWATELEKWQPHPFFIPQGSRQERMSTLIDFNQYSDPAWLIINPQMIMLRNDVPAYPHIHDLTWESIVVDECHKGALRNPRTVTARAIQSLSLRSGGKKIALSGTPMTNKTIDLWGILNWLDPKTFSSKWTWAERWCILTDNGFGKVIGELRQDRKEEFFRSLTPYLLRRTQEDVWKDLPAKQRIDKWCVMDPRQAKQYKEMELSGMARIKGETINTTSVLSEFLRLKQFANALHTLEDKQLKPTAISGKMDYLLEILEEYGVFDSEGDEKIVIFSQFRKMVEMIVEELTKKGVDVVALTGRVKERKSVIQSFQKGKARVIVMTTTAGGVAITLDKANTVIFMDETWSPADQEQAENRIRSLNNPQTTIYTLRSKTTIDQYIMEIVMEKSNLHKEILDIRRKILENQQVSK